MSDLTDATTVVEKAASNYSDTLEITGTRVCDDGSVEVTVTVDTPVDPETCKVSDTGNADVKESGMSAKAPDTDTNPDPDCVGAEEADDDDAQESSFEGSDPTNGEVRCSKCGGVFGSKSGFYGHMSSCEAESDDFEAADGATPSKTEDTGGSEQNTNDTGTNDENDGVSDEYLLNHGVKAEHIESAKKSREKYGVCHAEGCEYGAKSAYTGWCGHDSNEERKGTKGIKSSETSDSSGENKTETSSTADKVQEVKSLFNVTSTVARQAIEGTTKGHFGTTKEAIDHFEG